MAEAQQVTYTPEPAPSEQVGDIPASQVPILSVDPIPITPESPEVQEPAPIPAQQQQAEAHSPEKTFSYVLLLQILWVAGMVITAFVFLFSNIRFALRLKRTRQGDPADCPLPVYRTAVIDTPCLFGLLRPAIYLTEEAGEDEGRQHILTHELTHHKHLDHIWGFLRCICLILHWYNPLVWMAAILSRRDSELACDEAVIKQLGEENRAAYGKTLIRMTCTGQNIGSIFTTATTMTGSKKTITQRIKLIVKHPKTAAYAVVCLALVAAITVGCTFTGAKTPKDLNTPTETTPEETETKEETENVEIEAPYNNLKRTYPYGRLIYVNNSLYSMSFPAWGEDEEDFPQKIGEIKECDYNTIPTTEFSSNYFPVGTDVYQYDNKNVISLKYESDVPEVDALWLYLRKTSIEELHRKPLLTVADLEVMLENRSQEEDPYEPLEGMTQYRGNGFTSGFWSYCCELQDADYYLKQYADELALVRLSDMKHFDLYTEDLNSILKSENQVSVGNPTISGLMLNAGFNLYADYLDYTVSFSDSEQGYIFSTHNHLFVADLNVLINSSKLSHADGKSFDSKQKTVSISFSDIYDMSNQSGAGVVINELDQLRVRVSDAEYYYESNGLYDLAVRCLSEHTQKSEKYYKVDNISNPHTYSVYGFDTSAENNRTPYWVSLTDDNYVYVWWQFGTGTMFRSAVFYDPNSGRVSPSYLGPTDYYQNMVVSYGYNDEGTMDFCTVQVCDIFSGEVLFTVDEYKTPINRSMWNAVNLVYFNRDGSAILVNYYDEDYNLQWDVVPLPTQIRLNRTVGPDSRKIPEYDSGIMTEKPWEKQESLYSGVPDERAAREICQAVMEEKFPEHIILAYPYAAPDSHYLFYFSNEDGTERLAVYINTETGELEGIGAWEFISDVDQNKETNKNLLTSPVIADAETAGRIAEAIRAGWVRQSNQYIPYLCVQEVFYEEATGYWVVLLWPAVSYPVDQTYYIVLDSKDGHIVNMWAELG